MIIGAWVSVAMAQGLSELPERATLLPIGDVNGDGLADVAVVDDAGREPTVRVWLGHEYLLLVPNLYLRSPVAGLGFERLVPLGDVNGDGYDDVGALQPDWKDVGALHVFLGAAYGLSPTSAATLADIQDATALGDLDGDGRGDVAALSGSDLLALRGRAGGDLTPWALLGTRQSVAAFGAADVDGDGQADDLVVLGQSGAVVTWRRTATWAWRAAEVARYLPGSAGLFAHPEAVATWGTPSMGRSTGPLTWGADVAYPAGSSTGYALAVGATDWRTFGWTKAGPFELDGTRAGSDLWCDATPVVLGDLDGDGDDEVVASRYLPMSTSSTTRCVWVEL